MFDVTGNVCGPTCGNGILEVREECDDGNVDDGDGCTPICYYGWVGAGGCYGLPLGVVSSWSGETDATGNPVIALDAVGGNNGEIWQEGPTFITAGYIGDAFNFDGQNDYVSIRSTRNNLDVTSITIEAWVNPTVLSSGKKIVFDKFQTYNILVDSAEGYTCYFKTESNSPQQFGGGPVPAPGDWHHVACTYDETTGTGTLYVDGVPSPTQVSSPSPLAINDKTLYIGGDVRQNTTFTGLIDELTIYNRALDQGEIQEIVDSGTAGKCDQLEPPSPETEIESDIIPKNRYISFFPGNTGKKIALRVRLKSLGPPGFDLFNGRTAWVGAPVDICETSSVAEGPCVIATFKASTLFCDAPLYRDWSSTGLLNVFDSEIVPGSVYEVQAVEEGCHLPNENCFSEPLEIKTIRFGKILPDADGIGDVWDGDITIDDALEGMKAFSNAQDNLSKIRTEIAKEIIDNSSNIDDVIMSLQAFSGGKYSFNQGISNCGDSIPPQVGASGAGSISAPNPPGAGGVSVEVASSISVPTTPPLVLKVFQLKSFFQMIFLRQLKRFIQQFW